jgi:TIR domain
MSGPYGEIITFYSYKGGTGRSMVLANVGYLLSADRAYGHHRVLLIDWDLEAPGLERFFSGANEVTGTRPGLIDYLGDMARYYRGRAPGGRIPESMARDPDAVEIFQTGAREYPLSQYITPVGDGQDLWLMHAGRRSPGGPASQDRYWEQVRAFDWDHFYRNYGSFFTHFREMLMAEFDYVLIDSRTGLTDISGICTRVMPEKLVLIFAPNHQNIDGVVSVATKSIDYRLASRDPRNLTVFPVASRIDASASVPRTVWRQGGEIRGELIRGYQATFEDLLRKAYRLDRCELGDYFDATQIPHDSDYAYGEAIAAAIDGTSDRFSIGYACDQLARRLVRLTAPWEETDEQRGETPRSVLISYRRADSAAAARLLYDGLSERLGRDRVFMDVGPAGIGMPWSAAIDVQLETAGALLVLIGRNWLPVDWRSGSFSDEREPSDFVRGEIAAALGRDLPVIPVLLDDAPMPTARQLPPELRPLTERQAISLQSTGWDRDVDRLASALLTITGLRPSEEPDRTQTTEEPDRTQTTEEPDRTQTTEEPDRTQTTEEPDTAARRSVWARIAAWFRSLFS